MQSDIENLLESQELIAFALFHVPQNASNGL